MTIDSREYWNRRDSELAEEAKATQEYIRSFAGQLHKLSVQLSATPDWDKNTQSEILNKMAGLKEQQAEEEEKAFLKEWTQEITQSRREEWNTWVRNTRPKPADITRKQNSQGWRIDSLKKAVVHYNL